MLLRSTHHSHPDQSYTCADCAANEKLPLTCRRESCENKKAEDGGPERAVWLYHIEDGVLVGVLKNGPHLQAGIRSEFQELVTNASYIDGETCKHLAVSFRTAEFREHVYGLRSYLLLSYRTLTAAIATNEENKRYRPNGRSLPSLDCSSLSRSRLTQIGSSSGLEADCQSHI